MVIQGNLKDVISNLENQRDNLCIQFPLCYYDEVIKEAKELNLEYKLGFFWIDPIGNGIEKIIISQIEEIKKVPFYDQVGYTVEMTIKKPNKKELEIILD